MQKQGNESARGTDGLGVRQNVTVVEAIQRNTKWGIKRFASAADAVTNVIYPTSKAVSFFGVPQQTKISNNVLLNSGINELWTLACSASGTKFNSTAAYLVVGNSTVTAGSTQTGLQASSTNRKYVAMMANYPTYGTAQKATWRSEFGSTQANFDWNEFSVANGGTTAAKHLNRKVSSQGTKAQGQVWQLTLEITLS